MIVRSAHVVVLVCILATLSLSVVAEPVEADTSSTADKYQQPELKDVVPATVTVSSPPVAQQQRFREAEPAGPVEADVVDEHSAFTEPELVDASEVPAHAHVPHSDAKELRFRDSATASAQVAAQAQAKAKADASLAAADAEALRASTSSAATPADRVRAASLKANYHVNHVAKQVERLRDMITGHDNALRARSAVADMKEMEAGLKGMHIANVESVHDTAALTGQAATVAEEVSELRGGLSQFKAKDEALRKIAAARAKARTEDFHDMDAEMGRGEVQLESIEKRTQKSREREIALQEKITKAEVAGEQSVKRARQRGREAIRKSHKVTQTKEEKATKKAVKHTHALRSAEKARKLVRLEHHRQWQESKTKRLVSLKVEATKKKKSRQKLEAARKRKRDLAEAATKNKVHLNTEQHVKAIHKAEKTHKKAVRDSRSAEKKYKRKLILDKQLDKLKLKNVQKKLEKDSKNKVSASNAKALLKKEKRAKAAKKLTQLLGSRLASAESKVRGEGKLKEKSAKALKASLKANALARAKAKLAAVNKWKAEQKARKAREFARKQRHNNAHKEKQTKLAAAKKQRQALFKEQKTKTEARHKLDYVREKGVKAKLWKQNKAKLGASYKKMNKELKAKAKATFRVKQKAEAAQKKNLVVLEKAKKAQTKRLAKAKTYKEKSAKLVKKLYAKRLAFAEKNRKKDNNEMKKKKATLAAHTKSRMKAIVTEGKLKTVKASQRANRAAKKALAEASWKQNSLKKASDKLKAHIKSQMEAKVKTFKVEQLTAAKRRKKMAAIKEGYSKSYVKFRKEAAVKAEKAKKASVKKILAIQHKVALAKKKHAEREKKAQLAYKSKEKHLKKTLVEAHAKTAKVRRQEQAMKKEAAAKAARIRAIKYKFKVKMANAKLAAKTQMSTAKERAAKVIAKAVTSTCHLGRTLKKLKARAAQEVRRKRRREGMRKSKHAAKRQIAHAKRKKARMLKRLARAKRKVVRAKKKAAYKKYRKKQRAAARKAAVKLASVAKVAFLKSVNSLKNKKKKLKLKKMLKQTIKRAALRRKKRKIARAKRRKRLKARRAATRALLKRIRRKSRVYKAEYLKFKIGLAALKKKQRVHFAKAVAYAYTKMIVAWKAFMKRSTAVAWNECKTLSKSINKKMRTASLKCKLLSGKAKTACTKNKEKLRTKLWAGKKPMCKCAKKPINHCHVQRKKFNRRISRLTRKCNKWTGVAKNACLVKLHHISWIAYAKVKYVCRRPKCRKATAHYKKKQRKWNAKCVLLKGAAKETCVLMTAAHLQTAKHHMKKMCKKVKFWAPPCKAAKHLYLQKVNIVVGKCAGATSTHARSKCYKSLAGYMKTWHKHMMKKCGGSKCTRAKQLQKYRVAKAQGLCHGTTKNSRSICKANSDLVAKHMKLYVAVHCAPTPCKKAKALYKQRVYNYKRYCATRHKKGDKMVCLKTFHKYLPYWRTAFKEVCDITPGCYRAKQVYVKKIKSGVQVCHKQGGKCWLNMRTLVSGWYKTVKKQCPGLSPHSQCYAQRKIYNQKVHKALTVCQKKPADTNCFITLKNNMHNWLAPVTVACAKKLTMCRTKQKKHGLKLKAMRARCLKFKGHHFYRCLFAYRQEKKLLNGLTALWCSKHKKCTTAQRKYAVLQTNANLVCATTFGASAAACYKTMHRTSAQRRLNMLKTCAKGKMCIPAKYTYRKKLNKARSKCAKHKGITRTNCMKKVKQHRKRWWAKVMAACGLKESAKCKALSNKYKQRVSGARRSCLAQKGSVKRKCLRKLKTKSSQWQLLMVSAKGCTPCQRTKAWLARRQRNYNRMCRTLKKKNDCYKYLPAMKKIWKKKVKTACTYELKVAEKNVKSVYKAKMVERALKKAVRLEKKTKAKVRKERLAKAAAREKKKKIATALALEKARKAIKAEKKKKRLKAAERLSKERLRKKRAACNHARSTYFAKVHLRNLKCSLAKTAQLKANCYKKVEAGKKIWYKHVKTKCTGVFNKPCKLAKKKMHKLVHAALKRCPTKNKKLRVKCLKKVKVRKATWKKKVTHACNLKCAAARAYYLKTVSNAKAKCLSKKKSLKERTKCQAKVASLIPSLKSDMYTSCHSHKRLIAKYTSLAKKEVKTKAEKKAKKIKAEIARKAAKKKERIKKEKASKAKAKALALEKAKKALIAERKAKKVKAERAKKRKARELARKARLRGIRLEKSKKRAILERKAKKKKERAAKLKAKMEKKKKLAVLEKKKKLYERVKKRKAREVARKDRIRKEKAAKWKARLARLALLKKMLFREKAKKQALHALTKKCHAAKKAHKAKVAKATAACRKDPSAASRAKCLASKKTYFKKITQASAKCAHKTGAAKDACFKTVKAHRKSWFKTVRQLCKKKATKVCQKKKLWYRAKVISSRKACRSLSGVHKQTCYKLMKSSMAKWKAQMFAVCKANPWHYSKAKCFRKVVAQTKVWFKKVQKMCKKVKVSKLCRVRKKAYKTRVVTTSSACMKLSGAKHKACWARLSISRLRWYVSVVKVCNARCDSHTKAYHARVTRAGIKCKYAATARKAKCYKHLAKHKKLWWAKNKIKCAKLSVAAATKVMKLVKEKVVKANKLKLAEKAKKEARVKAIERRAKYLRAQAKKRERARKLRIKKEKAVKAKLARLREKKLKKIRLEKKKKRDARRERRNKLLARRRKERKAKKHAKELLRKAAEVVTKAKVAAARKKELKHKKYLRGVALERAKKRAALAKAREGRAKALKKERAKKKRIRLELVGKAKRRAEVARKRLRRERRKKYVTRLKLEKSAKLLRAERRKKKRVKKESAGKKEAVYKRKRCLSAKKKFYKRIQAKGKTCTALATAGSNKKCRSARKLYYHRMKIWANACLKVKGAVAMGRCRAKLVANRKAWYAALKRACAHAKGRRAKRAASVRCFKSLTSNRGRWYASVKRACKHYSSAKCRRQKKTFYHKVKHGARLCNHKKGLAKDTCLRAMKLAKATWYISVATVCNAACAASARWYNAKIKAAHAHCGKNAKCNAKLRTNKKTWYYLASKKCKKGSTGAVIEAKKKAVAQKAYYAIFAKKREKARKKWVAQKLKAERAAKKYLTGARLEAAKKAAAKERANKKKVEKYRKAVKKERAAKTVARKEKQKKYLARKRRELAAKRAYLERRKKVRERAKKKRIRLAIRAEKRGKAERRLKARKKERKHKAVLTARKKERALKALIRERRVKYIAAVKKEKRQKRAIEKSKKSLLRERKQKRRLSAESKRKKLALKSLGRCVAAKNAYGKKVKAAVAKCTYGNANSKCYKAKRSYFAKVKKFAAFCSKLTHSYSRKTCFTRLHTKRKSWFKTVTTVCAGKKGHAKCVKAKTAYHKRAKAALSVCNKKKGKAHTVCHSRVRAHMRKWYKKVRTTCLAINKSMTAKKKRCYTKLLLNKKVWYVPVSTACKFAVGTKKCLAVKRVFRTRVVRYASACTHKKGYAAKACFAQLNIARPTWFKSVARACNVKCEAARVSWRGKIKRQRLVCAFIIHVGKRKKCYHTLKKQKATWKSAMNKKCRKSIATEMAKLNKELVAAKRKLSLLTLGRRARAEAAVKMNRQLAKFAKTLAAARVERAVKRAKKERAKKRERAAKRAKALKALIAERLAKARKRERALKQERARKVAAAKARALARERKLKSIIRLRRERKGKERKLKAILRGRRLEKAKKRAIKEKKHKAHLLRLERARKKKERAAKARKKRLEKAAKRREAAKKKAYRLRLARLERARKKAERARKERAKKKEKAKKALLLRRERAVKVREKAKKKAAALKLAALLKKRRNAKCLAAKKAYYLKMQSYGNYCKKLKGSSRKLCFKHLNTQRLKWYKSVKSVCTTVAHSKCQLKKIWYKAKVLSARKACKKKTKAARQACFNTMKAHMKSWKKVMFAVCRKHPWHGNTRAKALYHASNKVGTHACLKAKNKYYKKVKTYGKRCSVMKGSAMSVCYKTLKVYRKTWYRTVKVLCKKKAKSKCQKKKVWYRAKVVASRRACKKQTAGTKRRACYKRVKSHMAKWKKQMWAVCKVHPWHSPSL